MKEKEQAGHLAALFTVLIWGTTFISTKILLQEFVPVEILFFRFVIGFLALVCVAPRRLKISGIREEVFFIAAGFSGICLYYLLENIALTYTMASNVGVMISVAPFFTAILAKVFLKTEEKFRSSFFLGFFIAVAGIVLLSFNGARLELNPAGDLLAVGAAFVWAIYSVLMRKISGYGYSVLLVTRRIFFYGILFMVPVLSVSDFHMDFSRFSNIRSLFHMAYLGLGASALCFVTWNLAVKRLGAVKTSVYIYMVPVVTVITSAVILKEPITGISALGTLMTVAGLFVSGYSRAAKRK